MEIKEYIVLQNLENTNAFDIGDYIWWEDESLNIEQKVNLTLKLLDLNPEYEFFMLLDINFDKINTTSRNLIWTYFSHHLSGEDTKQRDAVEHSLCDDFFNDEDRVQEAWNAMIRNSNDGILQRLLINSGPVPYDLKDELYQKLLKDTTWHYFILESLFNSFSYGFGEIDFEAARKLLPKLKAHRSSEKYLELFEALNKFNSKKEYWESLNH